MGGAHAHPLHLPRPSPLHRLRPQCKLAALFLFVLAVVATPTRAIWAFGVFAAVVVGLAVVAGLPLTRLARRLVIEVPFVAFAVFLPLVGQGERVDVVGLSLSVDGLWGAWNILVKGTIGVAATVVMTATTAVPEILRGLERLRFPRTITSVMTFMVRYGEVITDEMGRMRVARESRGYDPRWLWQARAVAASAATLFIRSYERGERAYLAMVSRGWQGYLPALSEDAAPRSQWAAAMALPLMAAGVASTAWLVQ